MGVEQAHAFLDAVEMDQPLRERIAELRGAGAIRTLCAIAAEAGFVFTEEDYRAAVVARSSGELSDESLEELMREMAGEQEP